MPVTKPTDDFDSDLDQNPNEGMEEDAPRALLNLSVLAGKPVEVGDQVLLRVTKVMPDQIEVEYPMEGEAGESPDDASATEAPTPADGFYE